MVNRQQQLIVTLRDLLNVNSGLFRRFDWFCEDNKVIQELALEGDQIQLLVTDGEGTKFTLVLPPSIKARNFAS